MFKKPAFDKRAFLALRHMGNSAADRILASIIYISDKKGINGKTTSSNWVNLLSVTKGYGLEELDYLKIYAENRYKYDDKILRKFIEEQLKKKFYYSPLDNDPKLVTIINYD